MITFRYDVGGTVVVQDYRQVRADGAELTGHGVFWAEGTACCGGSSRPAATRR